MSFDRSLKPRRSGQSTLEYLLLLSASVVFVMALGRTMKPIFDQISADAQGAIERGLGGSEEIYRRNPFFRK
jgi:hypothetical protein